MSDILKKFISDAKASHEFQAETLKIEFAIELNKLMEREAITKTALAQAMGVTKPHITKILRGDTNVTIETMAKAAGAAKGRVHIKIVPERAVVNWFDVFASMVTPPVGVFHAGRSKERFNFLKSAANDYEAKPLAS